MSTLLARQPAMAAPVRRYTRPKPYSIPRPSAEGASPAPQAGLSASDAVDHHGTSGSSSNTRGRSAGRSSASPTSSTPETATARSKPYLEPSLPRFDAVTPQQKHEEARMVRRLVECIPRAPLCLSMHNLDNIFIREDARAPLVLASPWTSGASTEEASGLHSSTSADRSSSRATLAASAPARYGISAAHYGEAESQARRRYAWGRYASFPEWVLNLAGAVALSHDATRRPRELGNGDTSARLSTTPTTTPASASDAEPDINLLGVYVSFDKQFVTVATSATEAGCAFARHYFPPLFTSEYEHLSDELAALPGSTHGFCDADLCYPSRFTQGPHVPTMGCTSSVAKLHMLWQRCAVVADTFRKLKGYEAICGPHIRLVYFGDDFVPPPPPAEESLRPYAGPAATSFSPHMLAAMLPTHFVPVSEFLRLLPAGYTVDHVRGALSATDALQVVEVGNTSYVRFYGGKEGRGFLNRDEDGIVPDPMAVEGEEDEEEDGEGQVREGQGAGSDRSGAHGGVPATDNAESDSIGAVHRRMASYEPDPFLAYSFLPRFQQSFQWLSLYDVVEKSPPAVKASLLPLREHATLLFFAQLPQFFMFTPERGGGVCRAYPPVRSLTFENSPLPREVFEVAELLRTRGLVFVSDLENDAVAAHGRRLSGRAMRRIIAHFGTLRRLLYQHEAIFVLSVLPREHGAGASVRRAAAAATTSVTSDAAARHEGGTSAARPEAGAGDDAQRSASANPLAPPPSPMVPTRRGTGFAVEAAPPTLSDLHLDKAASATADDGVADMSSVPTGLDAAGFPRWLSSPDLAVITARAAKLMRRSARTEEEKLERAEATHNRLSIRKHRRRLASATNPSSPYLDPNVLLDAVACYIPPGKHVSVNALLKTLPHELAVYLPGKVFRWLGGRPDKVILFEYRYPSNMRIMRAGEPLPEGRLRSSYSKAELLYLVAALLAPGRFVSSLTLFQRLPFGARETIKSQFHHLINLLEEYPQYFVVVHQAGGGGGKHTARVQLIAQPPQPSTMDASEIEQATQPGVSEEEQRAIIEREHAMLLEEMPHSLRATLGGGDGESETAAPH